VDQRYLACESSTLEDAVVSPREAISSVALSRPLSATLHRTAGRCVCRSNLHTSSQGQREWLRARLFGLVLVALLPLLGGCNPSTPSDDVIRGAALPTPRLRLQFEAPLVANSVATDDVRFSDRASATGLQFTYHNDAAAGNLYLPEALGGGAAAFDFDLDGWCDVYLANGRALPAVAPQHEHRDALFRNAGGTFQEVTEAARLFEFDYSHGCAIGDFNADGFDDLLVANLGQPRLFVNQGDGTFQERLVECFSERESFWTGPLFVDLNRDGLEDLLVASYVDWHYDSELEIYEHGPGYPSPGMFAGGPYLALENMGDGRFEDRTQAWGFNAPTKCLGISAVDLDHDLIPEVYIANDAIANACYTTGDGQRINNKVTNATRHSSIPVLARESGSGPYWHDIAEKSGTAGASDGLNEASMCVTLADFTRNGWTDIFVTNYYMKKNTLYANKGDLSFRDVSRSVRLDVAGRPFVSFGAVPIDFNLDGWWDVFVANGHVLGPKAPLNQMPCQVLLNSAGIFTDISSSAGDFFNEQGLGRCVVTLDTDNRGLPDVLVTYCDRPVALVRHTVPPGRSWLCLEVVDPQHRPLTGGRLELVYPDRTMVIPWTAGGSYIGESQRRWSLGIADAEAMPTVRVHWPDGVVDTWESLEPTVIWRLTPGRFQDISL